MVRYTFTLFEVTFCFSERGYSSSRGSTLADTHEAYQANKLIYHFGIVIGIGIGIDTYIIFYVDFGKMSCCAMFMVQTITSL